MKASSFSGAVSYCRNNEIVSLGNQLAGELMEKAPADQGTGDSIADFAMANGKTLKEISQNFALKIRENIQVGDYARFKADNSHIGVYMHHDEKVAVVVELAGENATDNEDVKTLANELGMHITWNKDVKALTRDGIDQPSECRDTYKHVGNVPSFGHQVAVRGPGRNVEHIAGAHLIRHSTSDGRAPAARAVDHVAPHQNASLTTPHEHHVNDVIVDLRDAVRIAMNEPEAVGTAGMSVVGEGLPGRVIRTHPGGEGPIAPCQL